MSRREAAKGRVLIVEDNPLTRLYAIRVLEKSGFAVKGVSDGLEAVRALRECTFDVILMDCEMPVMDGYETTRVIREADIGGIGMIPIIAMTGNQLAGDAEKCIACGMSDYISKPVLAGVLVSTVRKWVAPVA